jgi:hypothetical protein
MAGSGMVVMFKLSISTVSVVPPVRAPKPKS